MWHRVIDCLGVAVEITSRAEEIDALLEAVVRTYAEASRPADISYSLEVSERPTILRDGQVIAYRDLPMDLVPALELDLNQTVLARAAGFLLHAGAIVGAGGEALVFAGRSGAGKSTLVRGLLGRGFAYLTEECVALHADGRCTGLCRPLHVEDERVALPPRFASDDYPIRRKEHVARVRLFQPPADLLWHGSARVAAVLQIEHGPEARGRLERLSGGEALAALWPLTFRIDASTMEEAAQALGRTVRYRLCTARAEDALARVLDLARELDVRPL